MAETDKPTSPEGQAPPQLPAFPGQEEDFLFKLQMSVANAFYGYWKHALGLVVVGLLGVFVYGTWQNHVRDTQRDVHAQVAKVQRTLRAGLEKHADDEAMAKAQAVEGGKRFAGIAQDASGAGAVYAWIKAAQAFKIGEDSAQELEAWKAAHAVGAEGSLGWSAALGLAGALAESGDVDGAAAVLKAQGQGDSYEAQLALYELGRVYELAGRTQDGIATLEGFQQRFPESVLSDRVSSSLNRMRGQG